MMSLDEQRDYLEAVDELRRLQIFTVRPMHALAMKKMREQEQRVDAFTAKFLERIKPTVTEPASSSPM